MEKKFNFTTNGNKTISKNYGKMLHILKNNDTGFRNAINDLLLTNQNIGVIYLNKEQKRAPTEEKFKLSCHQCSKRECIERSYCHHSAQCYLSHHMDESGEEIFSRGCIQDKYQVPFICATAFKDESKYYRVKCCNQNLCNNATFESFDQQFQGRSNSSFGLYTGVAIGAFVSFVLIAIISTLMLRRFHKKRKLKFRKNSKRKNLYRDESGLPLAGESSLREILSESVTSGSGSGLPLFVQRTLAKNISLETIVGKGRYGEVWKGIWQGEPVAVKIFFTRDENSWARETEIYSTILLRHENILGFYGSDMTSMTSCTQLWLVTHFHHERSLFDFLQRNSIDHAQLLNICSSLIGGIHHLHAEILGTQGKPAIAHRDITSRNVLMKGDGACCIADLGLAVLRVPETGEINMGSGSRTGTKRYMSPELLNGTINAANFDSYRKVDMYAAAIVMWEAAIRCRTPSHPAQEYQTPFGDIFPYDPSFEELRQAVCDKNVRPRVPSHWKSDPLIGEILSIVCECWHRIPDVRLTSLRVKKNLTKLAVKECIEIVT